jgi:CRISPR-associated protein Cas1
VRDAYAQAAQEHGIPWKGRKYNRENWDDSDPVNQALSTATACLYGLCHAAIVALGYSPALGFIHSGKQLSFVYDVADLYKLEVCVPAAFHAFAEERVESLQSPTSTKQKTLEQRTRHFLRNYFCQSRLLKRIPKDIAYALNIPIEIDYEDPWAEDASAPASLWTPGSGLTTSLPVEPAPIAPELT